MITVLQEQKDGRVIRGAIEHLPAGQRAIVTLRGMEGREPDCQLLCISIENQRVLLRRARGWIRQTINA